MNNYIVSAYALIVALILYLSVTETHFFPYVWLRSLLLRQWFQRRWFCLWAEPSRPWNRVAIYRNSNRLARQLMKEIQEREGKK